MHVMYMKLHKETDDRSDLTSPARPDRTVNVRRSDIETLHLAPRLRLTALQTEEAINQESD